MRTVVMLILVAALALLVPVPAQTQAATSWTVKAGASASNQADQALLFLPKEITINEGDTVQWKLGGAEHTIYFPAGQKPPELIMPGKMKGELLWNPDVFFASPKKTYDGMGPISGGALLAAPDTPKSYALTFTKAGTYKYLCMFHPGMEGTITVQAAGSAYPETQAQYDEMGAKQAKPALAKAQALREETKPVVTGTPGKRTFTLTLTGSLKDGATFFRFPGGALTISRGDSVTWVMKDPNELHTVSFGAKKGFDVVSVKPQPQGPPALVVTKEAMNAMGGKVHRGAGFYNSGFLATEAPGTPSYTLTFTRKGTFEYTCAVHDAFGMRATIVVK